MRKSQTKENKSVKLYSPTDICLGNCTENIFKLSEDA